MVESSGQDLPSMEALQAVLAVVRSGSLSAAAIDLGVSHAALSRRIAEAEQWVGTRLFERHGRGMRPTARGQRIAARAAHALEQLASLREARVDKRIVPTIRLATTPSFARWWVLPRLSLLEGSPRDVRVEVIADIGLAGPDQGEADVAIRFGRGGWPGVAEEPFIAGSLVPVAAHIPGLPTRAAFAGFVAGQPLLHAGDTTLWAAWHAAMAQRFRVKDADRTLADYALTLDAAADGLGVALWNPAFHDLPPKLRAAASVSCESPMGYRLLSRKGETNTSVALLIHRLRAMAGGAERSDW